MSEEQKDSAGRRWAWRLMALAILFLGLGGFIALQIFKPRPQVSAPAQQQPLVRVAAVEFREGALPVVGNGVVRPRMEVVLAAEVSGRVAFISPALVTGGRFERDEVLIRLDQAPFKAALAQARAERESALASLKLAEQQLKRTKQLIEENFLSRQTLDERQANRDQAASALARAEAVEQSRRLDQERTVIRAPFDGRVLSESVDVGETVQPGKQLARIFADDALEVPVSLTDREVSLIKAPWQPAQKTGAESAAATVTVEYGGARYRWPGRVDRVEAAVESATRTFNVIVRVNKPNQPGEAMSESAPPGPPLLVGMYARVEIAGRDMGRYALVPRRALRSDSTVWLLAPGDVVAIQSVKVLHDAGREVAVQGLEPGDRIITSDLNVVTRGMPVRVVDEGRAAAADAGSR